jgi:hypothetical protein
VRWRAALRVELAGGAPDLLAPVLERLVPPPPRGAGGAGAVRRAREAGAVPVAMQGTAVLTLDATGRVAAVRLRVRAPRARASACRVAAVRGDGRPAGWRGWEGVTEAGPTIPVTRARARAQDVRVNGQPTVPALLARMLGAADAEDEAAAGVGAEWGGTAVGALRALADLLL